MSEPRFRVLFVDDDDDTREGWAMYLRLAGLDVNTAANGSEATRKARSWLPHVIVMDLSMPGMDGRQALRVLRQRRRTRSIPMLAFSAQILDRQEEDGLRRVGFDACCRKPCLPSKLLAIVLGLVRRSPGPRREQDVGPPAPAAVATPHSS